MGTTLTGTTPQDTYDSLIKVTDNGPISATVKLLSDGLGNDSALALSTARVGIGTTSNYSFNDDAKLAVANTSGNSTISIVSGTASNGYLAFADGTTGTDRYTGSINYNHSTNAMTLHTNAGNERMIITSAGNVGIGLSAPTQKLEIQDGASGAAIKVSNSGGGSAQLAISSNATSVATLSFTNSLAITGGNVGIGTTAPNSKLEVFAGTTIYPINITSSEGAATTTGISMGSFSGIAGGNNGSVYIASRHHHNSTAQSDMVFYTHTGSALTEKGRFLAAGGLTFNGDTAAANALDDYEEGTWSPVINGSVSNPTVTYTAANTGGIYTKIGNQVTVSFEVRWSALSGGSGTVIIAGLPFARRNTLLPDGERLIIDSYDNTISGKYLIGNVGSTQSSIALSMVNSAASPTDLIISNLSASGLGFLRGTATYFV